MSNQINFKPNPLFPEMTLFLGNGFDLSLGLHTKYTEFFEHKDINGMKDFWPTQDTISEEDQLYKRLNEGNLFGHNQLANPTWYDLEDELKQHAKRNSPSGIRHVVQYHDSIKPDQYYFERIKNGLTHYLKYEVERWGEYDHMKAKSSAAFNLMYQVCVKAKAEPNIITFNYTDIQSLMSKCGGDVLNKIEIPRDRIQHVHGSLLNEHIILGTDEDKEIPQEYDFLFKSWDDYYGSHQVIDTLKSSEIIIFFGLSFGSIDSVYFVDFFKSIIRGAYDDKKHIVICTYNEQSMRDIYRQFFVMGISIMELKAHCDFHIMLTNPDNPQSPNKFNQDTLGLWLREWNDITINV